MSPLRHPWRALAAAVLLAACAYDTPLTSVSFPVRYGGFARDASQPLTLHTNQGWEVTLTAAEVAVGPLYLYNAAPATGTTDADGRVVGEVLARFTVNALDPTPVTLPTPGRGVNEAARSAEVRLYEPDEGPVADAGGPGNAVAHVAGTATRDGQTVNFDGALILPSGGTTSEYLQSLQHRVQQVPVALTPAAAGALVLRVDPSHWFDSVEFATPTGAPVNFEVSTGATQLLAGLRASAGVYAFTWEPP